MKKPLLILLSALMLASCAGKNAEVTNNQETVSSESGMKECGDIIECEHTISYHSINSTLIDYVGQEEFNKWCASRSNPDPYAMSEDINIVNFIRDFNIPKDVFISDYYDTMDYYMEDYDIDLIYSDDDKAIEEYFRDKDASEERIERKVSLFELKSWICYDAGIENTNYRKTSVKELVELAGRSADESIAKSLNASNASFKMDDSIFWDELLSIDDPYESDEYFIKNVIVDSDDEEEPVYVDGNTVIYGEIPEGITEPPLEVVAPTEEELESYWAQRGEPKEPYEGY